MCIVHRSHCKFVLSIGNAVVALAVVVAVLFEKDDLVDIETTSINIQHN